MSDWEDEGSLQSGTSVPSIGDDVDDPQIQHLVVSQDRCRAMYRSSSGDTYICPRETDLCHKRNHIRIRVTNRGDPGIYEIHRGTRGGFRGIYGNRRLTRRNTNDSWMNLGRGTELTLRWRQDRVS
jgi:hypothetical protein